MPRSFSELKSGGTIPMLSPHPEKWGNASPRSPPIDARGHGGPCVYVFSFFVFKFANEKRKINWFFVFKFANEKQTYSVFDFAFRMLRSHCHIEWPVKVGSFGGILRSHWQRSENKLAETASAKWYL